MRIINWFTLPAAAIAFCCSGVSGAEYAGAANCYSAPEPEVAACSYTACDDCGPAPCEAACDSGCGTCDPCGGCGCGCSWLSLFPCRCSGDPWTLQSCLTGDSECYSYGGWVSAGAYANSHGAANNGPVAMRDVGDGFTVNQIWGFFERAADTGGCGLDWGFRVDYVFGADGPDTQAFGSHPDAYDNPWDSARDYGSALPQLYGQIAVNNLTVTMGHFYTIIGYEVVPATGNFFYSHAYTMYFGEPFTHTGVLGEYALNDITLWGGWTQGWDTGFDNYLDASTFLGGASVPVGDALTLTYALNWGDQGPDVGDIYMQSIVADLSLTEKLNYVLQSDWGGINDGPVDGQWYGVNNYLLYSINDCWGAGMRFEWFRDDDGIRVGDAGDYYGLTCGINWIPRPNVRFRPELRYDWYDGAGALPFDDGQADDQLSGGFDLIVTF